MGGGRITESHGKLAACDPPPTRPGTYALLLRIDEPIIALIGRRGRLPLAPGWAVYAGSAFGPGGVTARLAHHRRPVVRPHWHIDYLRQHGSLAAVWFSHDPVRRECLWAAVLAGDLGGTPPPFRFGASDCRCSAHLYLFRKRPVLAEFAAALRARCPAHVMVVEELRCETDGRADPDQGLAGSSCLP